MPMQCGICGHVEDTKEEQCPKCGSAMRYSLLAGYEQSDDQETIVLSGHMEPTWANRVYQVCMGVLWTMMSAVGLAFACVMFIAMTPLEPDKFASEEPMMFTGLAVGITLLASIIAVYTQLKGVYLAQLVAPVIAVCGTILIGIVRVHLGIPMQFFEWLVVPIAGLIAFPLGLRIAGQLEKTPEITFKPIDNWDRKAKPTARELSPALAHRWKRLFWGACVGMSCLYGLPQIIAILMAPLLHNPQLMTIAMQRLVVPTHLLAWIAGGVFAGAGTRAGFIQGVLTGVLMWGMEQALNPSSTIDGVIVTAVLATSLGAIGGVLGRYTFRPYRIFGNAKGVSNAPSRNPHGLASAKS